MTVGAKISEMTAATTLDGSELFEVVQGGDTKAATAAQVISYAFTSGYALTVASLSDLKALTTRPGAVRTQYRATAGDQGGGEWVFSEEDQSANITADPLSGVWAAPNSDSSGASGAWQRQYDYGTVHSAWWGVAESITIVSGTYDSGTGIITLTLLTPINFEVGAEVSLPDLSGTGAFASLVGEWSSIAPTSGTTVTLSGPSGAGAATITAGLAGVDNNAALGSIFSYIETLGLGDFSASTIVVAEGRFLTSDFETAGQAFIFQGQGHLSTRFQPYTANQDFLFKFTNTSSAFLIQDCGFLGSHDGGDCDYGIVVMDGTTTINRCRIFSFARNIRWLRGNRHVLSNSNSGDFTVSGIDLGGVNNNPNVIVSGTWSAGVATLTMADNTGLLPGSNIAVSGCTPSAYNDTSAACVAGTNGLLTVTYAIASNPGALTVPGQIDGDGGAVTSECRIIVCQLYGAGTGSAIRCLTDNGATQVYNSEGGSSEYGISILNDLNVGASTRGTGFLTLQGYTSGATSLRGLNMLAGGASFVAFDSNFSGTGTGGVGCYINSASGNPCFYNCDWHKGDYGIHGVDFTRIVTDGGQMADIDDAGIFLDTGATGVLNVEGTLFTNDLAGDNMDYAIQTHAAFAGTVNAYSPPIQSMVIADYNVAGGTLNVESPRRVDVSSSLAAQTVTQRGSGDVVVWEDVTSPDASPNKIDAAGRMILADTTQRGFQSGLAPRLQANATGADNTTIGVSNWASGATTAGTFALAKARGNTVGTHTVVASGDLMGTLSWAGSDGTAFIPAATIRAEVDGTPGTNDMPGRAIFSTTPDGTAVPTEKLRLTQNGVLIPGAIPATVGAINYAADAQANDTYVITLSPVPTAYATGMQVIFKANTANTGAATLNVNGLGAVTIVKAVNTALANNDILANMFCLCVHDGTNFVLMNPRVL